MITWAEFKASIRRSILKDNNPDEETGEYRWSDDELFDFMSWALSQVARHTAVATATSVTVTGQEYDLPSNTLSTEPFDINGVVRIVSSAGNVKYLDPIKYTGNLSYYGSEGFYTIGSRLVLTTQPKDTDRIEIEYFAHYDVPDSDDDVISVPRWMIPPLSYLVGAHALSGAGLKTSFIRQWGARPDTGTPEHNPLKVQQKWFFDLYESEMAKHPPQDRTNHTREYE
jgi:hypothetical protein